MILNAENLIKTNIVPFCESLGTLLACKKKCMF